MLRGGKSAGFDSLTRFKKMECVADNGKKYVSIVKQKQCRRFHF